MSIPKTITIAPRSKYPITVNRLGYGTMRLTGEGIYGEPPNRPEALQILKRAMESGLRRRCYQPPHCRSVVPLSRRFGDLHQSRWRTQTG